MLTILLQQVIKSMEGGHSERCREFRGFKSCSFHLYFCFTFLFTVLMFCSVLFLIFFSIFLTFFS